MLDIKNGSPGLWEALYGLNIKALRLRVLNVNHAACLSQSISSFKHMESIELDDRSLGLLNALRGLNIKSLSLSGWFEGLNVHNVESLSQELSSLTHLETLSIDVHYASPILWKVLCGLNIKTLSLSGWFKGLYVNHVESLSQQLSSLQRLETLSIYMRKYINIQLPHSLKYLNIYCYASLPSELRELVDTLSGCTQTVESKLEFGCASFDDCRLKRIPSDEYIVIQQELETLKNVAVKRFRILYRKTKINGSDDVAESAWYERDAVGVDDDYWEDDNIADNAYTCFVRKLDEGIINRISLRLLITPASNS
ncbi:uncharacterized protein LOC127839143 [Dreissena polymorpha]|nr:uncharacterized protein LOC127839143 [Dreissena polymorpha]